MNSVVSVKVSLPRDVEWQGRVVHTVIWKHSVRGRVMARWLNLDGDGQGDLAGHGGEQRAVMVYQLGSYRYGRLILGGMTSNMVSLGKTSRSMVWHMTRFASAIDIALAAPFLR
jgi:MOSC domain-containing protein YiiM